MSGTHTFQDNGPLKPVEEVDQEQIDKQKRVKELNRILGKPSYEMEIQGDFNLKTGNDLKLDTQRHMDKFSDADSLNKSSVIPEK